MILPLCEFNGRLYVPRINEAQVLVDIYSYEQVISNRQHCFVKINTIEISSTSNTFSHKSHSVFKEVPKLACIFEVRNSYTGLNSLYFLVIYENCTKNADLTIYSIEGNIAQILYRVPNIINTFVNLANFPLRLQVLEGPRLFWVTDNDVNVFSSSKNVVNGIQILQISLKSRLVNILFCDIVGSLPGERTETLFILAIKVTDNSSNSNDILILALIEDLQSRLFHKDAYPLRTDFFIPRQYTSLVTCVNIILPHSVRKSLYHGNKILLGDICWENNTTLICTGKKQFLVFIGGCLRYCCEIPFCDVWHITKFIAYFPFQVIFILQSSSGACAVKRENYEVPKCFQMWEAVVALITGDIVGEGSSQLLLLKNLHKDKWFDGCIITDLHKVFFPISEAAVEFPNSKQNTICGIRNRLIAGQATLVEEDERIRGKQVFIDTVLRSLTCNVKSNSYHVTVNAVLVDILSLQNGKEFNSCESPATKIYPESVLKVISEWKTVIQDQWIIGWTIKNICDSHIFNLQNYSTIREQPLEIISKLYKHPPDGLFCQPSIKCRKWMEKNVIKKNDIVSFVFAVPLPLMSCGTVTVNGVMSWDVHSMSNSDEKVTSQQSTFCHTLSIGEIIGKQKQNFQALPLVQQLMSLRVAQQSRILSIISLHTDLNIIEDILTSSCEVKLLSCNDNISANHMAFLDYNSPLYGINFAIHYLSLTEIEMELFFREENQLLLFIHWLYGLFADDIIILPTFSKASNSARARQMLLLAIKEEVEIVSSLASKLQHSAHPSMVQKDCAKDIYEYFKKKCQSIRQDSEQYRKIRKILSEKEQYTDKIICSLKHL